MSVTYTAQLPAREQTVFFLTALLFQRRRDLGIRTGSRSLTPYKQAILVLRWMLDATRVKQLAADNSISKSTAYDYLNEGIDVLAAQAPTLHGALLAAKAAGYDYVLLDGTLIETDRIATPGPTPGVDLWWSAKHKNHGGNIQVLTAPDGWPLWTSPVRPGREHDTTCLRTHPDLLPTLAAIRGDLRTLTDLGYEGEADTVVVAFKKPKNGELTNLQQTLNRAHNRLRAVGERGNSLLKMTFKALRNVSLNPRRIGAIVAAALVILHTEHARTTRKRALHNVTARYPKGSLAEAIADNIRSGRRTQIDISRLTGYNPERIRQICRDAGIEGARLVPASMIRRSGRGLVCGCVEVGGSLLRTGFGDGYAMAAMFPSSK